MNKRFIVLIPLFLLLVFLFSKQSVKAAPSNNPIFATIEKVQQMITTALSSTQSSIQGISNRVSNLETTVTPIPSEIAGIQTTLTPIPGEITDIQATLTPIPGQITNLQNRVSTLESILTTPTPTSLPQKVLKTFDNNGNELGLYVDRQIGSPNIDEFFYVPLGKIVVLADHQIGIARDDVWYQSSDCTGTAYAVIGERAYWSKVNEIYTAGPGKYYTIDRGSGSTVSLNSLQRYDGSAFPCLNTTAHETAWSLTPVTLPFTEPIALPLQYKYQ